MKYYLIKIEDRELPKAYGFGIDWEEVRNPKECVELTEEELQEIECWMNKNSQDIINNKQLCKIVEKIRKVLDNDR